MKGLTNINSMKNLLDLVKQHGTSITHTKIAEEKLTCNYSVIYVDGQKFIVTEGYDVLFE